MNRHKDTRTNLTETDPKHCALLEFPESADPRGNLSFLENGRHIPFDIKRVFYLYDVPAGARRAAHALVKCQQCNIAIAGSLDDVQDLISTRTIYGCMTHSTPSYGRKLS